MRSIILITLTLFTLSCTKQNNVINNIPSTSMVEFDFDGNTYKQTVNKDGTNESGNKGFYSASVNQTSVQSNDGTKWNLSFYDNGTSPGVNLNFDGDINNAWSSVYETDIKHINITKSKGLLSGDFEATLNQGLNKKVIKGTFKDVPYTNL